MSKEAALLMGPMGRALSMEVHPLTKVSQKNKFLPLIILLLFILDIQNSSGKTAQVSAVPRTKVKVSGGTQTCSSDLQQSHSKFIAILRLLLLIFSSL